MTYPTPLIPHGSDNFGVLQETFRWKIPEYFNIAEAVCDRHQVHRDRVALYWDCLLYTSDAADDMQCVDLGGRRIIKK